MKRVRVGPDTGSFLKVNGTAPLVGIKMNPSALNRGRKFFDSDTKTIRELNRVGVATALECRSCASTTGHVPPRSGTPMPLKRHEDGTEMPLFVPLATSKQGGVMTTLFGEHPAAHFILLDESAAKEKVTFDDIGNGLSW